MQPHHLTTFEIQKCYHMEPKFNAVYSINSLLKIKDGVYVTNLDHFKSIGTRWKALYVNGNNVIYFDRFRVEHISKETEIFIGNKNIITNIYRIQIYNLIICGHFCIGYIFILC